jgi:hypothetical protein
MFKRVDVLAIAILIALIYLGVVIGLQMEYGLSTWAEDQHLNILGDSIGGLTAPLALIFLVAAVIIQRQELILTKKELAASAKALSDQVIEQRQHREFVGQQTELMRKEAEASAENTRKAYKLSLFDRRYAIYLDLKGLRDRMRGGGVQWWNLAENLYDLNNRARFLFGDDLNNWLQWLRDEVEQTARLSDSVNKLTSDGWIKASDLDPSIRDEVSSGHAQLEAKYSVVMTNLDHHVLYKVFAESMEVTD